MNIQKTRQYYEHLTDEDVCDCAYCQNYVRKIRKTYPELAAYLDQLGIDIEKPFETIPIDLLNGKMLYSSVQYVVMGTPDDFEETSAGSVSITVTDSHPMTDIKEAHFVIEASPVFLDWTGN